MFHFYFKVIENMTLWWSMEALIADSYTWITVKSQNSYTSVKLKTSLYFRRCTNLTYYNHSRCKLSFSLLDIWTFKKYYKKLFLIYISKANLSEYFFQVKWSILNDYNILFYVVWNNLDCPLNHTSWLGVHVKTFYKAFLPRNASAF